MEDIRLIIRDCLKEIVQHKDEPLDYKSSYYNCELQRTAYDMAVRRMANIFDDSSTSDSEKLSELQKIIYAAPMEDMKKLKQHAKSGKSIFEK